MQGFITNTTQTSLTSTSTFASTLLAEQTSGTPSDARSRALPQACDFAQLDLVFSAVAGIPTFRFDCYLTWDSAGDDPLTAKIEGVATTAAGTSNNAHTVISLDRLFATAPSGQTTAGKVYLWIMPTEAVVVEKARLHWHDNS